MISTARYARIFPNADAELFRPNITSFFGNGEEGTGAGGSLALLGRLTARGLPVALAAAFAIYVSFFARDFWAGHLADLLAGGSGGVSQNVGFAPGKVGTAFARYGDSPERNGVPAKKFAVVATDDVELESSLARYEPTNTDVSIVVDDTMCKGIESWAWYGIQPINKLVVPGGSPLLFPIRISPASVVDRDRCGSPQSTLKIKE